MSRTASNPVSQTDSPPMRSGSVHEAILRFLWRQWSQLGVAGEITYRDPWMIDPEALLLFTLQAGRFDPRLFDEVLAWCLHNADSLSIQRMKNLLVATLGDSNNANREILIRTVAAFATVLDARDTTVRFRALNRLAEGNGDAVSEANSFFIETDGSPLPFFGEPDPHFRRAGWLRSPVSLRHLSVTPPLETSAALLLLRLRALFGLSPRAETVAYLLTHPTGGIREIARATTYSPAAIHETLASLARGGYLSAFGRGNYTLDAVRWQAFLDSPLPVWVDWVRVLPAVNAALTALMDPNQHSLSPYLMASRMLRLYDTLREALFDSGLPNPFANRVELETVMSVFPEQLATLLNSLDRTPV